MAYRCYEVSKAPKELGSGMVLTMKKKNELQNCIQNKKKRLEAECSWRTCTTSANESSISTNTLNNMGSTNRTENWVFFKKQVYYPGEQGDRVCAYKEKKSLCAFIKWSLIEIGYAHFFWLFSKCYPYTFMQTVKSVSLLSQGVFY